MSHLGNAVRGDDFYTPVKASEASINILCTHNFHYHGLFTSDPGEYRISHFIPISREQYSKVALSSSTTGPPTIPPVNGGYSI